jgi:hypothetical protein
MNLVAYIATVPFNNEGHVNSPIHFRATLIVA